MADRQNQLKLIYPNLAPAAGLDFKVSCWMFADTCEKVVQRIMPPPLDKDCKLLTLEFNKNWKPVFTVPHDSVDKPLADVATQVFETYCYAYKNIHLPPKEAWLDQTKNQLLRIAEKTVPTSAVVKRGLLELLNDFREIADPERFWREQKPQNDQ